MAVIDYLITDDEVEAYGVRAAPDMLTGTARQNKEVFDRLPVLIAKEHVNPVIRVFAGIENETQGWAADEQARVTAEAGRAAAEQARSDAETGRAAAEQARAEAEAGRAAAEQGRAEAEAERDTAENARKTAEAGRAAAENARVLAEQNRKNTFETELKQAQDANTESKAAEAGAAESKAAAAGSAAKAESYAVGGTGTRTGEDTDNSKYYALQAAGSKTAAANSANAAANSAVDAAAQAEMAKEHADRAEAIVGGDFATRIEAQGYVSAHDSSGVAHNDIRQLIAGKETAGAAQVVQGNLQQHMADAASHVTADERTEWNAKSNAVHASRHAVGGEDPLTPADIGAQTRDNLLDNPYFINPVNQRGQTSYTGPGGSIDRWKLSENVTLTLTSTGITLVFGDGYRHFTQSVEDYKSLAGKTITASFLVDSFERTDGIILAVIQDSDEHWSSTTNMSAGILSVTHTMSDSPTRLDVFLQSQMATNDAPTTLRIRAAKLEIGETQTLARMDANGNWVLNEIPDYGEQLARCQRYALALSAQSGHSVYGSGMFNDGQYARIIVPLPVTMRTVPSISVSGDLELIIDGGYYSVNSVFVEAISPTAVCISVGSPVLSSTHSPAPALLRSYGGGKGELFLSAEL